MVKNSNWDKVTTALLNSWALLEVKWEVAADYMARDYYDIKRELPGSKGFSIYTI